jgi:cobalamin-dependent methionine synthase I
LTLGRFLPIMPAVASPKPRKEVIPMLIIGELINSTRKQIRKAIEEKNGAYIQELAKKQAQAGANWIDVNAGAFPTDEVQKMQWLISVIREVTEAPLSVDSPRAAAVEAGLAMAGKDPFLNSISAESDRYKALIPLVKKYGARVVALSMDDAGMTDDMNKVWEVADGLIKRLEDDGVPPDHIFVDPLIRPVSTNGEYGMAALGVVEKITAAHPQVHKTCGLSNVSYGLPKRKLVNQVFVAMAIAKGMDSAIIDPLDPRMMANIAAAEALAGKDQFCMGYITAEREGRLEGME